MSREIDIKKIHRFVKQQNLNKSCNIRALMHVIIHIGLLIGFYFLTIASWEHDLFILSVFFYFIFCFIHCFLGTAGISHELFHNNVFKNKIMNKFLYNLFMILTFNNPGYFSVTHNLHHKHTLSDDDPKEFISGKLTFTQLFFWTTFDILGFLKRFKILVSNAFGFVPLSQDYQKRKCELGARLVLVSHITISFLAIFYNKEIILLFTLSCPFVFTLPNKILAISQHYDYHEKGLGGKNFLENTRSLKLPNIISFLYANMNYHVEHHYAPSVPFYNLPHLQDFLIKESKVDYRMKFFKYLPMLLPTYLR